MRKLIIALILAVGFVNTTAASIDATNYLQELKCLADNVYHEARSEPELGQILVARVTINRTTSSIYPKSICEVVYQPKQFSWTSNIKFMHITDLYAYDKAVKAAIKAFTFNNSAIYFHNHTVVPNWAKYKTKLITVGNHTFYK